MTVSKYANVSYQTSILMPKRTGISRLITLLCKPICDLLVNSMVDVLLIVFELN